MLGNHTFALPTNHFSLAIEKKCRNGFKRLARKAGSHEFAPLHIEATVCRTQRSNRHIHLFEGRHPTAIRSELCPAPAAQSQHNSVRFEPLLTVWDFKVQSISAIGQSGETAPTMAHMQTHTGCAQSVKPGPQQRSSFHADRKHASGRSNKRGNPQALHPGAHGLWAKRVKQRSNPMFPDTIPGAKLGHCFGMRDIHSSLARHQELSPDGRHGVEYPDIDICATDPLCCHQTGRSATDDGDNLTCRHGIRPGTDAPDRTGVSRASANQRPSVPTANVPDLL